MSTAPSRLPGPGALPGTLREGRLALCEELARDGAQGKTLLLGPERVDLLRRTANVMGEHADECLVAMVGFPAIGHGEVDCVRQCQEALDVGYQQVVCRTIEQDLLECVELMRDAHAGRVLLVVPASAPLASAMMHTTPEAALELAAAAWSAAAPTPRPPARPTPVTAGPRPISSGSSRCTLRA